MLLHTQTGAQGLEQQTCHLDARCHDDVQRSSPPHIKGACRVMLQSYIRLPSQDHVQQDLEHSAVPLQRWIRQDTLA